MGNTVRLRVLCLALATTAAWFAGCDREDSEGAAGSSSAVPVTVALPLKKKIVEWDRYVGRFAPVEGVEVRSRVGGYVESVHFDEGTVVEKGQLLFVIDQAPLKAAVAEAEGMLHEAQAARLQADARLSEAEAVKIQATAQNLLTKNQVERARSLVDSRTLTREEFEIRLAEAEKAKADVIAADAGIAAAKSAIEAADALVESATARLETAKLDLSYSTITAPIKGRIGTRLVTPGNLITGGSASGTLLATIVAIDPIHVYFDASERDYLKYARLDREGSRGSSRETKNPVYVRLSDEKGYEHVGHMDFVDNRLGQGTGTIRGRAIFRNPSEALTPGLFAEIRIPGSGVREGILVPDGAIGNDQNRQVAYVVGDGNKIEVRPIETGPIVHGLRVVRSGLTESDLVVIEGLQMIGSGALVEPSEPVELVPIEEGLPDEYVPVPEDQWVRPATPAAFHSGLPVTVPAPTDRSPAAANGATPRSQTTSDPAVVAPTIDAAPETDAAP